MNSEMIYKFRAWDDENKIMYYSDKKHPSDIWFSLDNGKVECLKNYAYCDSFGDEHDQWEPIGEVEPFTGLTDKKGIDIYKGDIAIGNRGGESYKFHVKWDEENARFLGYTETGYICYVGQEPSVEVIGNIHEGVKE